MRRLGFLVRKEFQELRRNPRMFPVIFVAPVLQLFILGYAATTDVKNVPMMVVDADRSAASRDLVSRFDASPYFTVVDVTTDDADVLRAIEGRRAWMALSIPPDYGEMVGRGQPVTVQVITDGTDSNSATVGMAYASTLITERAAELAVARRRAMGHLVGMVAQHADLVVTVSEGACHG